MNTPSSLIINTLKKELILAIIQNDYNLLSPEILSLSKQLDELMVPLFKNQLKNSFLLHPTE
ncbi:MAG: hypothetical protein K0S71_2493 [Clostridia bacterium]|jgi:hypothetical protein|nr:hypothetical protein [Clostridia bacterium]